MFMQTNVNNEWNIFFQIVPLAFIALIPLSFFIGWSTSEIPFDIVWTYIFF